MEINLKQIYFGGVTLQIPEVWTAETEMYDEPDGRQCACIDVKMTSPGDYLQQFEMLKNNQIDAVVCDEKVAQGFVDTSDKLVILSEKLAEDNLCITVKTGHTFILQALNRAISEFVSSGESDNLKSKWGL